MPSLRELQTCVMEALLEGRPHQATPLVRGRVETLARRLGVYENTVFANFLGSLQSTFPVVERLVGEAYFRQTVRGLWRTHPSRSGDLLHAGAPFAGYLADVHGTDEFAYLGDVARFEWLCEKSLLAAESGTLDLSRLAAVEPERYDFLNFVLHPSLRLFESRFPVLRIWQTHSRRDAEPATIDLCGGGDRLALLRNAHTLRFLVLEPGEHAFLTALDGGAAFSVAVAAGSDADAAFDATAALARFVGTRALVDFR